MVAFLLRSDTYRELARVPKSAFLVSHDPFAATLATLDYSLNRLSGVENVALALVATNALIDVSGHGLYGCKLRLLVNAHLSQTARASHARPCDVLGSLR